MDTFQILRNILASSDPCAMLLRELTVGFGFVFVGLGVLYPASRLYFRRATTEREKKKRIIGFFIPLFLAMGGFYGWMFWRACQAPVSCDHLFDLNCEGKRPVLWLIVMLLGFVSGVVAVVYEIVRSFRARGA